MLRLCCTNGGEEAKEEGGERGGGEGEETSLVLLSETYVPSESESAASGIVSSGVPLKEAYDDVLKDSEGACVEARARADGDTGGLEEDGWRDDVDFLLPLLFAELLMTMYEGSVDSTRSSAFCAYPRRCV